MVIAKSFARFKSNLEMQKIASYHGVSLETFTKIQVNKIYSNSLLPPGVKGNCFISNSLLKIPSSKTLWRKLILRSILQFLKFFSYIWSVFRTKMLSYWKIHSWIRFDFQLASGPTQYWRSDEVNKHYFCIQCDEKDRAALFETL